MGAGIFNIALDALMVIAITGLWVVWFLQAGQRKKVEKMLVEASSDLQAATELLASVMGRLEEQRTAPEVVSQDATMQQVTNKMKQDVVDIRSKSSPTMEPNKSKDASQYSAQILRLNREGLSEEDIADELEVPVAQVHLILLLQAPKV